MCSVWWCAHTLATISLNPSQTHSHYLPNANVPLHSREGKTCRQTYCFPPLFHTRMCMLVHTHTYIDTVLVRCLLSLKNGAFFTIGDIFPFNAVNAAMPQISDYCWLRHTKKTKQENVMTCWLEQHQCAFDFRLQLWVWAESGWLLPTETGIAKTGTISRSNTAAPVCQISYSTWSWTNWMGSLQSYQ